jgi:hypothetical protein
MAKIESINIMDKVGEYFIVYAISPLIPNMLKAEILDANKNVLFSRTIYATNIEGAANQLNLKIIK